MMRRRLFARVPHKVPASPVPAVTVPSPPRLSSYEVDALRVRALKGDPLHEVRDGTREWVLRSLLWGRHLKELAAQAGLQDPEKLDQALARIRCWYQQRLDQYKQSSR